MHCQELSLDAQSYFNYWDELSIHQGMVQKGSHIVILFQCARNILQSLQLGHQDKTGIHQSACISVFWPWITKDIDVLVETCNSCQRHCPSNPEINSHSQIKPSYLIDYVVMDITQDNGYLMPLATDYFKNFTWTLFIFNQTSTTLLEY